MKSCTHISPKCVVYSLSADPTPTPCLGEMNCDLRHELFSVGQFRNPDNSVLLPNYGECIGSGQEEFSAVQSGLMILSEIFHGTSSLIT